MSKSAARHGISEDDPTITMEEKSIIANKKKLLKALGANKGMVYKSCRAVSLSHVTHYNYLEKDQAYAEKVEEITNHQIDLVEFGLINMTDSSDEKIKVMASKVYLDAKAKNRGYGTQKQELSGEMTNKVVYVNTPSNSRIPPRD